MATGKRGRRFPEHIKDLDFSMLHNSQYWILADWMNARKRVSRNRKEPAGDARLREFCMENLERAQDGYSTIILGKRPNAGVPVDAQLEKRLYETVSDVIIAHEDKISEVTTKALNSQLGEITGKILALAQSAVNEAAERTRPIVIKEGGKTERKRARWCCASGSACPASRR